MFHNIVCLSLDMVVAAATTMTTWLLQNAYLEFLVIHTLSLLALQHFKEIFTILQPFDGKDQTCHKRWVNWCNYVNKKIGILFKLLCKLVSKLFTTQMNQAFVLYICINRCMVLLLALIIFYKILYKSILSLVYVILRILI